MNPLKVILLILLASSYSCDEKVSQVQSLPDDEYYQKIEKDYSDFKNRIGDHFENTLPDIPKETRNPIKVPANLIKCFESEMPQLPGLAGTLTRSKLGTGPHSIHTGYQTKINDKLHSGTLIDINIYQSYEQARRFANFKLYNIPQKNFYKVDNGYSFGDYSWSADQHANSPSFSAKILFTNLDIHIIYREWAETSSKDIKFPVDASKRKEEVCGAIIKLIQDCQ